MISANEIPSSLRKLVAVNDVKNVPFVNRVLKNIIDERVFTVAGFVPSLSLDKTRTLSTSTTRSNFPNCSVFCLIVAFFKF